ncbi:HTH domain-containing protein [Moorena sp. SIO3I6]|uniref:HTH domain-containing protein n=1 Tax=Moorena sp. SIO3I6 TaxID=2607831 RepID=UPI0013FCEE7A|nr:HTH domain-containing protein [Moorena sp. SIO3I6]NEP24298.1 HTH domain-containing protein [Moorena sp. SIO3I6]
MIFLPELAGAVGKVEAFILQEIHYWSIVFNNVVQGRRWYYKSGEKWAERIGVSERTVRRAVKNLRKQGLVYVKRLSAKSYYQVNWYSVNYQQLKERVKNIKIFENFVYSVGSKKLKKKVKRIILDDFGQINSDKMGSIHSDKMAESYNRVPSIENSTCHPPTHPCVEEKNDQDQEESNQGVEAVPLPCDNDNKDIKEELEVSSAAAEKKRAIAAAEIQLRRLQIKPAAVMKYMIDFYANIGYALNKVEEAVREGWVKNRTGLLIHFLKEGADEQYFEANEQVKGDPIPSPPPGFVEWCNANSTVRSYHFTSGSTKEWVAIYTNGKILPWYIAMKCDNPEYQPPQGNSECQPSEPSGNPDQVSWIPAKSAIERSAENFAEYRRHYQQSLLNNLVQKYLPPSGFPTNPEQE